MKLKIVAAFAGVAACLSSYAQKPELVTQEKNMGIITKIVYSPNGRYIASANEKDFNIKIWDVQSSKLIGTLPGHEHSIRNLAFHTSGDYLFSFDTKNKNYIWDLNTWNLKDSIVLKGDVEMAECSTNGNWLYVYTSKNEIWEINPTSPTQQTLFAKTKGSLTSLHASENLLLAANGSKEIIIYNSDTKKESAKIKVEDNARVVKFDGQLIVALLANGNIVTYNLKGYQLVKSTATGITPNLADISVNQHTVAFPDNDKQIQVWNYETGTRLYTMKNDDNSEGIKSICFSREGTNIATSGYKKLLLGRVYSNNNVIQVWDVKNQKVIKTLKGDVKPIDGFAFSPGKNQLYVLREQEINVWDLNSSERIAKATLHERKIEVKDRVNDNVAEAKDNTKDKVKGTKLDRLKGLKDGDLSGVKDRVKDKAIDTKNNAIQETKALGKAAFSRLGFQENKIIVSQNSNYMLTALKGDEIRLYKFKDGMPEHIDYLKTGQKEFYDLLIDPNERFIVVGGSGKYPVSIIPVEGERKATTLEVDDAEDLRMGGAFQTANAMALTADGSKLVAVFNTGRIVVWETSGWYKLTDFRIKAAMTMKPFVGFSKDGNKFFINTAAGVFTYDFSIYNGSGSGKEVALGDVLGIEKAKVKGHPVMTHVPLDYVVSVDDDKVNFLEVQNNKVVSSDPINAKLITDVQVNKYGYAGVSLRNGELRIYDPATGKQRFIMVEEDDNAIFKTPENYYKITKEGQDLVTFRVGKDAYPFEQFDAKFNRPDIVLQAMNSEDQPLITLYKNAYEKRLAKLGLKESDLDNSMHIPTLVINNLGDVPLNTDNNSIKLNITGDDKNYDLHKISVWINDVPVYGKKGIAVSGKHVEQTLDITLASGINKIQVAVENAKGSESLKQTIEIECTKKVKPNLYILSIGTSTYKDKRYNLNYAAKDAQDLIAIFANSQKDVYGSIKTKTITNQEATKINIENVKAFFGDATIDDVVIVFVAGHGILDPSYDYYYGTYDIDFTKPAVKGLAYGGLETILDGIKPLKKIMFMDTCHSGEVDAEDVTTASSNEVKSDEAVVFRNVGPALKTVDGVSPSKMMKELFTDLRRGTGTTVISSAGGAEYAMESDQWKNGLFTYCLLFGLRNESADLNQDGSIMLSELQLYVTDRVSQLSGGRQVPTTRIQNISLDYRVW